MSDDILKLTARVQACGWPAREIKVEVEVKRPNPPGDPVPVRDVYIWHASQYDFDHKIILECERFSQRTTSYGYAVQTLTAAGTDILWVSQNSKPHTPPADPGFVIKYNDLVADCPEKTKIDLEP
jgi:hypothetical protein